HHLRCRAVRPALAEVVLHEPRDVEPDVVGEPDLLEHLAVGALLRLALALGVRRLPRERAVDLVQQVELHLGRPLLTRSLLAAPGRGSARALRARSLRSVQLHTGRRAVASRAWSGGPAGRAVPSAAMGAALGRDEDEFLRAHSRTFLLGL